MSLIFELCMQPVFVALLFPLLPVAVGVAALASVAAGYFAVTRMHRLRGNTVGVIGMQEAGKTQLYRTLQGKPYGRYEATPTDDYDSFEFSIGDRRVRIEKGRDIGGTEEYILPYYADMIRRKDILFFVFDVERYLHDGEYAASTRARLDFVWRKLGEREEAYGVPERMVRKFVRHKYAVIGSHYDRLEGKERRRALSVLQKSVEGKVYAPLFHDNLLLADLTDREGFLALLKKRRIF